MKGLRAYRSKSSCGHFFWECGDVKPQGSRMCRIKAIPSLGILTVLMLLLITMTMKEQYEQMRIEGRWQPFDSIKVGNVTASRHRKYLSEKLQEDWIIGDRHLPSRKGIESLPRGIVQETSDLELKPLWSNSRAKDTRNCHKNLLAMTVGIKQKQNVNIIVRKFLLENFTVVLFHYDGHLDGWNDLEWNNKAIHIVAQNQTKWWFAKRFLHPAIVSAYDYIFIWDEDIGVENFHPGRYLKIMKSEGLEISQPALDPKLSEIHHRITIRNKTGKVHSANEQILLGYLVRRLYNFRGSANCSEASLEPPCTGWVEGMAPVFTQAAWRCTWHLIQNDLIHGWGMDMKLGYCAQGDRTKKVGVIDSEFIIHQGIPSLGGPSANKSSIAVSPAQRPAVKAVSEASLDPRSEIRRQSAAELEIFRRRWKRAVEEDKGWVDPFDHLKKRRGHLRKKPIPQRRHPQ